MTIIGYADNLVVRIAAETGIWQFHLMRAMMALPMIAAIAWATGWQLWPRRVWPVAVRGVCLSLSMVCYFGALAFLTVAEAVAGLFTAPVFVLLLSALWFRQRIGGEVIAAVVLGFLGTLVVLRPDLTDVDWPALMSLAGGFFYALNALATRRMCAGETTLSLLLGFFVALLIFSVLGVLLTAMLDAPSQAGPEGFMSRGWVTPSITVLALTLLQAVVAVVGVGLITRGYILAEAPQVAVFEYSLLIFAAFWGWVLWGDTLDMVACGGILLIFCSGALLFVAERRGTVAA